MGPQSKTLAPPAENLALPSTPGRSVDVLVAVAGACRPAVHILASQLDRPPRAACVAVAAPARYDKGWRPVRSATLCGLSGRCQAGRTTT